MRCCEVADALSRRGHSVQVLTSIEGSLAASDSDRDAHVHRALHLQVVPGVGRTALQYFLARKKHQQQDLDSLRCLVADFRPDIIFVWGMWNLPRSIPWLAEQLCPGRVVYSFSDYWLTLPDAYVQNWRTPSRRPITSVPKKLLSRLALAQLEKEVRLPLRLEHPICVSRAVRDLLVAEGVPVAHACIIHGGIEVDRYERAAAARKGCSAHDPLRVLYAGRLSPDKGVHTAVRALGLLAHTHRVPVKLVLAGRGDPAYESSLRDLVRREGLEKSVSFLGRIPYEEMPALMGSYDVLVFPSEWAEPFARTVLEGMAAGLAVIGTTTGGTGEILVEGETGLTFPAGNAEALAAQIHRLQDDPLLRQRLSAAGQKCVREGFTFERMVDRIAGYLQEIAYGKQL